MTQTGTIETIASHATVTAQESLNTAQVTLRLRLYIAASGSNTFNYTGTEYSYTPTLTGTVAENTLLTLNQTGVGEAVTEGDRLLFVLVADDSETPPDLHAYKSCRFGVCRNSINSVRAVSKICF